MFPENLEYPPHKDQTTELSPKRFFFLDAKRQELQVASDNRRRSINTSDLKSQPQWGNLLVFQYEGIRSDPAIEPPSLSSLSAEYP